MFLHAFPQRAWMMTTETAKTVAAYDKWVPSLGIGLVVLIAGWTLNSNRDSSHDTTATSSQLAALTVQVSQLQSQITALDTALKQAQHDDDQRFVSQVQFTDFIGKYEDNHKEAVAWRDSQEQMNKATNEKLGEILSALGNQRRQRAY